MPRIRSIKPKFWDDLKLSKVSRDARLLFIGMWNFADDFGVIISEPVWLKSKIFPFDKLMPEQLENWLKELVEHRFIVCISFNGENFYFIRNFNKHQRIDKANNEDVCIDSQSLMIIIKESTINPRLIHEPSIINPIPIPVGREGKGEERKGVEGKGEAVRNNKFLMWKIYDYSWDEYKIILNGQSKLLSNEKFTLWKDFIDYILNNGYEDLFEAKFVNPIDFDIMVSKDGFTKDKWDDVLKRLLSTGVSPQQNLFFRIPQFMKYKDDKHKKKSSHTSTPQTNDVYDNMQ